MWARRFIRFHGKLHPRDAGAPAITEFFTDLAVTRNVVPSMQIQALNFIYQRVKGSALARHFVAEGGVIRDRRQRTSMRRSP
jgi:hypothetical protein